ncbi:MAG: ubiquinol-cytochrome C reductase [candidate division NC10 bacterium RBG_16_65_8]|nr:MAG: ubiquinol-cytochrome C reductase [candidate division NC10 bacterium RBG_16_65_8]
MAGRWLLKTEPGEYSFEDLFRDGRAVWDGVTNPLALKHLRAIRKRDQLLIYHTGAVRAAVGLATAASDPYPDPTKEDPRIVVVDVVPVKRLEKAVSLAAIKADPRFREFELVRLPRLSVMPVPERVWKAIGDMAEALA